MEKKDQFIIIRVTKSLKDKVLSKSKGSSMTELITKIIEESINEKS